MRIVLVGAGRLATNLGKALCLAGHDIMAVYSYTKANADILCSVVGGLATDNIANLPLEADAFIVAVKDAALPIVAKQLAKGREQQVFFHTAGSMPLSVFGGLSQHYGVFYPMQTFSKERQVDFSPIPIFLEASDDATLSLVCTLAESISRHVYVLSSEDRKYLHLSAVFACNFANHCYALSAELLEKHGIPFDVMLPLVDETAHKVHELHPLDAQTGPAVRYDENVIRMQSSLLSDSPDLQEIYNMLSHNIHRKAKKQ
jgi:predicted short-subunit dehydrogenase-like oxidoreductase (DUF2520 family)